MTCRVSEIVCQSFIWTQRWLHFNHVNESLHIRSFKCTWAKMWFHPPVITLMGLLQSSAQFNAANCIFWSLSHVVARCHLHNCEGIIVLGFFLPSTVILQWWFIKSWCCWWRSWGEAQLSCSASPGRPFGSTRGPAAAAAAVYLVCPCHGVSTNNNKRTIISSNYLLCLGFSLIFYGLMQCFLNYCAH